MVATSSLERLITPDSLKSGAVICDMSRPSNVSEEVLRSTDVLVIGGRGHCHAKRSGPGVELWLRKGNGVCLYVGDDHASLGRRGMNIPA